MALMLLKLIASAGLISVTSWLAGKRPELAGFLIALPLSSMLALAFSYTEYRDAAASAAFAKSILVAVPLSLLFFLPFCFERLPLSFWGRYACGVLLIAVGYALHRVFFRH